MIFDRDRVTGFLYLIHLKLFNHSKTYLKILNHLTQNIILFDILNKKFWKKEYYTYIKDIFFENSNLKKIETYEDVYRTMPTFFSFFVLL